MRSRPLLRRAVEDRLQGLGAVRARRRRLAGLRDSAALGVLPVTAVEEPLGRQAGRVDVVQAAGIDADAVRVRTRDVEGVHAAMRTESVLRDTGAEGVGLERGLAAQQLEGGGVGTEVQDALLGADRAAAGRQEVEIDLGAESHLAAMTPAFPRFQHVRLLMFSSP